MGSNCAERHELDENLPERCYAAVCQGSCCEGGESERQEEFATKKLAADQKKREAEKTRLTKAAECQGKVASIWGVDFAKLNVRPVEILSMDTVDVKTLD